MSAEVVVGIVTGIGGGLVGIITTAIAYGRASGAADAKLEALGKHLDDAIAKLESATDVKIDAVLKAAADVATKLRDYADGTDETLKILRQRVHEFANKITEIDTAGKLYTELLRETRDDVKKMLERTRTARTQGGK